MLVRNIDYDPSRQMPTSYSALYEVILPLLVLSGSLGCQYTAEISNPPTGLLLVWRLNRISMFVRRSLSIIISISPLLTSLISLLFTVIQGIRSEHTERKLFTLSDDRG